MTSTYVSNIFLALDFVPVTMPRPVKVYKGKLLIALPQFYLEFNLRGTKVKNSNVSNNRQVWAMAFKINASRLDWKYIKCCIFFQCERQKMR